MKTVRLAMVGCGRMGQSVHLQNFLRAERCSVVAVCDQLGDLARDVAEAHRIPRHFDSVPAMLDAVEFDAAAAIVHWTLNAPLATELLDAGKHVFIEKPMASNADDAQRMADCARSSKAVLMVAYMKRYDPGCQRAKAWLDEVRQSGEMGAITYARVHDFVGDWTCGYDAPAIVAEAPGERPSAETGAPECVSEQDRAGYANWNGVFCHDMNLMRYLLGEPAGVRFSHDGADAGRSALTTTTVFDYGTFDCTLETGMIPAIPFDEGVRINFEKGWLRVDVDAPLRVQAPASVTICRDGKTETLASEWGWSFRREAQHFVECILNGEEPLSTGADSVRDVILSEKVYMAARNSIDA